MDDQLCFSTDYPHWDADTPAYIRRRLPPEWHRKVFYENALSALRWSQKAGMLTASAAGHAT
jgi:hypothetical protein